ncbi:hypothetical protein ACH5RR_026987 [Cinchona calisaya]|uniref:Uncharacterized protein n=1 Tax=Cinchona calisaya TaxID=153742 RepID=A0ABD2Z7F3_9GENT
MLYSSQSLKLIELYLFLKGAMNPKASEVINLSIGRPAPANAHAPRGQKFILTLQYGVLVLVVSMAIAFANVSWWLWSGKQHEHAEPKIATGNSLNLSPDLGLWESDTLKFPLVRGGNIRSSSGRVKRKWHSREERKIDKEYDVVIVPSDGGCYSGSESDDSDWSIGWLEPHGPAFQTDDDSDDNFAVLVRCYGRDGEELDDNSKNVGNIPDLYAAGSKKNMEQWLSFLQNN